METKQCRRCKELKLLSLFYERDNRLDGHDSWCKQCTKEASTDSELKNKKKWYNEDGCRSEREHFNKALQQLAETMNMPSLLKYMK